MSQRDVIFYQGKLDDPTDWTMNGLVPPLVMELKTDTLEWCTTSFKNGYPNRVRTHTLTNDRYLLKTCWCGPYVKMSLWNDSPEVKSDVYEPLARRMESAASVLNNVYRYFETYDILYALDFNTNLNLDLNMVNMSKHASFKIDTLSNLNEKTNNDGAEKTIVTSAALNENGSEDGEFYNPVYDKFGIGSTNTKEKVVIINSRLLSNTICLDDVETLKDPMSRVPTNLQLHLAETVMKKHEEYQKMSGHYRGDVTPFKPSKVKNEPLQSQRTDGDEDSNVQTEMLETEVEEHDRTSLYSFTESPSKNYNEPVPHDLMPDT